ncbi:MAG: HAD-IIIA family hydrolase [Saprospiraceae bacterium]|nr:HAD-IIIA family hydrolase [Saprospiraceae bacterium]
MEGLTYYQQISKIRGLVLDIDGVLTDNTILVTDQGEFLRSMNVRDGYAIKRALDAGIKIAVISGGKSFGSKKRLEILGINDVYLGVEDKLPVLKQVLQNWSLSPEDIAYMGDDIMDISCIKYVGLACAPADAVPETLEIADYISPRKGGDTCVRDIIEKILQAKQLW